jgi:hypothetical protein
MSLHGRDHTITVRLTTWRSVGEQTVLTHNS